MLSTVVVAYSRRFAVKEQWNFSLSKSNNVASDQLIVVDLLYI